MPEDIMMPMLLILAVFGFFMAVLAYADFTENRNRRRQPAHSHDKAHDHDHRH